jgi:hypothetical protein
MIKDVHINNPERPFQRGSNSESIRLNRAERSKITKIVKPVATGKVRKIVIAREVGDSVLYRNLSNIAKPTSAPLAGAVTRAELRSHEARLNPWPDGRRKGIGGSDGPRTPASCVTGRRSKPDCSYRHPLRDSFSR